MEAQAGGVVVDISSGTNNGTINGAMDTKGMFGRALDFDGASSDVDLNAQITDFSNPFTISTWIKPDTIAAGARQIFYGGADVQFYQNNNDLIYRTAGDGTQLDNIFLVGVWSYIVVTYDGTDIKLYNNGVLGATETKTAGNTPADRHIGSVDGSSEFFSGIIDETRIYNRVLSLQEIKDLYNEGANQVSFTEDYSDEGADGVVKLVRGHIKGTGSYEVNELILEQGDIADSWDFNNWSDVNIDTKDATSFATSAAGGLVKTLVTAGKRYRGEITFTTTAGLFGIKSSGSVATYLADSASGTYTFDFTALNTQLYFRTTEASTVSVTNFTLYEIPPLQGFYQGTKFLENNSAGTEALQSKRAYGTWEFDIYKGADDNSITGYFIYDGLNIAAGNGYVIRIRDNEGIALYKDTSGFDILFLTAVSYIANNTWYRFKITRTTAGVFTVYIRGGAFGDDSWTTVVTDSGTNPVTDNTYTTSAYTVLDLDAGDKITNLKYSKGIRQ